MSSYHGKISPGAGLPTLGGFSRGEGQNYSNDPWPYGVSAKSMGKDCSAHVNGIEALTERPGAFLLLLALA